jgi:Lipopolysaccharide-assembly
MKPKITRRTAISTLLGGGLAFLSGCANDGHFSILGYSTQPNYDCTIRSVYVPIFKSKIFETTPYRGMEFELTRAVIDYIEQKTPYKVVSDPDRADSELQGTIVILTKNVVNRTRFNEVRDLELNLGVQIVWHDLRPGNEGKILSNPKKKSDLLPPVDLTFDPAVPEPHPGPDKPQPVLLTATGRGIPELGETSTTALSSAIKQVAKKIVDAMEKPWSVSRNGE